MGENDEREGGSESYLRVGSIEIGPIHPQARVVSTANASYSPPLSRPFPLYLSLHLHSLFLTSLFSNLFILLLFFFLSLLLSFPLFIPPYLLLSPVVHFPSVFLRLHGHYTHAHCIHTGPSFIFSRISEIQGNFQRNERNREFLKVEIQGILGDIRENDSEGVESEIGNGDALTHSHTINENLESKEGQGKRTINNLFENGLTLSAIRDEFIENSNLKCSSRMSLSKNKFYKFEIVVY